MARIPDEEIERLKREIPIERLVKAAGIELRKHGADLIGRCPFHDDREPSLVVTPEKNLWHCLGACNTGGSVIDWIIKTRGVSFRHAVELLKADHPALSAQVEKIVRKNTTAKLAAPVTLDAGDQESLARRGWLLSRDARQLARGAAVSRSPRPDAPGDDRSLSSWASPTASSASRCRTRTARPERICADVYSGSASCAPRAAMST